MINALLAAPTEHFPFAPHTGELIAERPRLLEAVAKRLGPEQIERNILSAIDTLGREQIVPGTALPPALVHQPEMPRLLPDFDPRMIARVSFTALQEWEGTVTSVQGDAFNARLVDLTTITAHEESADVPLEEVQPHDRTMVKPGAVFRLAVGYQMTPGGSRQRVANLIFRRLPQWTRRDIAEADAAAQRSRNAIRLE